MARPLAVTGGVLFVALWFLGLLPQTAVTVLTICCAAACVAALCIRAFRRKHLLLHVCIVLLAACVLFQTHFHFVYKPIAALNGKDVQITAALADLPQKSGDGFRTTLRTSSIDGAPIRCRMTVYTDKAPTLTCRQSITFRTRVYASDRPGSSGMWLRAFSIDEAVCTDNASGFFGRMLAVRQYAIETLLQAMPGTNGAVLAAMITGNEQLIPADVYAHMRDCGIVHIFSVSGLHLSVFSMLLYRFLERRRLPRPAAVLPSAVLVFLLMAVTGFSYSGVRAGIMLFVMLFGQCFYWRSDSINSLGASLVIMALIDPFCAGDAGLQLSVLGTLGVVVSSPFAQRRIGSMRIRPRFLRKPVVSVLSTILVSACIYVLTLPVVVSAFGRVSLISPVVNALVLFAAGWAMIGAAAAVLLTAIPGVALVSRPILFGAGLLAKYCTAISAFFGGLPFSAARADYAGLRFWIAGSLIVIAAAILFHGTRRRKAVLCTAISFFILVSVLGFHAWNVHDLASVTVLDVGNQSAFLVQSRGRSVLIGCGGRQTPSRVRDYTDEVDLLIVPRAKDTECGSAGELVRSVRCGEIWAPPRSAALEGLYFAADPVAAPYQTRTVGDIRVTFRNASQAVFLEIYDRTVLMVFASGCDLCKIPRTWLSADILVSRSDVPPSLTAENYTAVLLARDMRQGRLPVQKIVDRGGLAVASCGEGDVILRIRRDGAIGLQRRGSDA